MGPWVHRPPNVPVERPAMRQLNQVVRFFAYWLRNEDTGIMKESVVSVYMQEYATPERTLDLTPGHWRSDADFPVEGSRELTLYLQEGGRLVEKPGQTPKREYEEFE